MKNDRLDVATKLLSALLLKDDSDSCDDLVDEAIKLADALIAKTANKDSLQELIDIQDVWIRKNSDSGVRLVCDEVSFWFSDWISAIDYANSVSTSVKYYLLEVFYVGKRVFWKDGEFSDCEDTELILKDYKQIKHLLPSWEEGLNHYFDQTISFN